ncbi:MAG: LysM peptidoglycan-binding domain-containing protein [Lachnospiraceae bacterium]|nr:LysM peptidoglycan-binding domain-containing protein [Lachnospiraceae bacterium]
MDYANYRCTGRIYVVKKGDSLYKIAKENGVTVNELMRANPYVNVYNMQIGEEICIPRNTAAPQTRCFRVNSMKELVELMMEYDISWDRMVDTNPQLRNVMIPVDLVVCIQED